MITYFFQTLVTGGTSEAGEADYFVSEAGTGNGLSSGTPMSLEDFEALVLNANDRVFFLEDDEF